MTSGSPTRVAAYDCGTNSLRLLIADVIDGRLVDVVRDLDVVRLGQGVDRTGRFDDEALERTFASAERFAALCREHGVPGDRVRFAATSATRDASNREEFIRRITEIVGVAPEVITGDEEAALSFRGAASTAPERDGLTLVVDLGGGSTELVLGGDELESAFSMDIGSVRMTERHVHSDPPTLDEVEAVRSDVRAALAEALKTVDVSRTATIVGVAGTITTVTARALGLERYDSDAIDGSELSLEAVLTACDELSVMPRAERASLAYIHPGRVDVIPAGAMIWAEVLRRVRTEGAAVGAGIGSVTTSEHDILDGLALSLA
ncbi:Ppx/GppA phosphatase [Labedella gwakjiensis]|uniref:Ppx/GppA family phosphatase n=1 Tax=Labedella gwakjiensis TaxID=390269 RepID=A0A2P8GVD8_9MICO|nr:Ppx/GppA phosphatase family protein [Labedella gwakjiensis]PSL37937.1 Ppx/GppA phosphatase [Labedella gwakjiensis]RUQ87497.1 Ppx/GppA family phosphatase [Labedella gwakjiensis]